MEGAGCLTTRAANDEIEERHPSRAAYLERVREAARDLIKARYLLREDLDAVMAHAEKHWSSATVATAAQSR